ncbi:early transcribed membrane protein [Plasmodium malariae]|uniref:Early transcribed membrane protein n=2 Tax=Plasmodium (Plasmodium) TaxID=418103 RepID=A0A1D3JMW0_PLAMA|nr:early transcribed membrane protein [Plasmodium malariae]SBT88015.1 early transcribed membrane protein [Plasmodium malariae]
MKITKTLALLSFLLAFCLFKPCMSKNEIMKNIKGKLDEFEKNMKKKEFKKKVFISSAVLGLAILANTLAGIGYHYRKKNGGSFFNDFNAYSEAKKREKISKEIMMQTNQFKEKDMAKNFKMGKKEHPKVKDIMSYIETEVKKRNLSFDKNHISDMTYDVFRNLYNTSELWKKNPNLIPK